MSEGFAIASGVIVLIGAPFYLYDILKGTTKPERTTWFIWSILGIVAFISQFKLGAHWSLVYVGLEAVGNLVVYGLSLKYGVGGWTLKDKLALGLALIGIIISLIMQLPIFALWGVILADFAGAALTIEKAFKEPKSETAITWIFLSLSATFASFAVGKLSFALLLYPVYLAIITIAVPIAQLSGLLRLRLFTK